MSVQQKLLQKLGEKLVQKYQASIPKVSGKTAASVYAIATDNTLDVRGAKYIGVLEYGRKPTKEGAPKGSPTLFEAIKAWCLAKGIISDVSKKSLGKVAFITHRIHTEGTKLYRDIKKGEPPSGVLTNVSDSLNLDELMKEITTLHVSQYTSEVIKKLKELQ